MMFTFWAHILHSEPNSLLIDGDFEFALLMVLELAFQVRLLKLVKIVIIDAFLH